MKKLFFFVILSFLLTSTQANAVDVFALPTNESFFYEKGYPLNEYLIYTSDKKCFLHYLSPTQPSMYENIQIIQKSDLEDVQCLEKGFATINITDDKNNSIQTLNGYFLNGFFIGDIPLNSYTIKRSAEANGTQNLFYFIEKDDNLKVQYIGKMQAHLINGAYTHFEACYPFELLIQTQNKSLFNNATTIRNLFTIAKSYAQTICPQVEQIVFLATDSPSLDKTGIFFQKIFYKDNLSDTWMEDTRLSFNYVLNPPKNKPAPDIPVIETVIKEEQKPELNPYKYIVHISDKTNKKVLFVDKPYIMKAIQNNYTLTLKPGWYKVKANLTPMEDLEKKRTGISLNEKADIIDITSAQICNNSNCD